MGFTDKNHSGNLNWAERITIAISSIFCMTFFTTSSPLYTINYWDDANCYFTLGRSIIHGLVPYKDVYEQKGPYIYFIHSLAAAISEDSFIGVYVLEIIFAIVFTIFVWKTVRLFFPYTRSSLALIPLQVVVTYSTFAFYYGDSAEEICFPFLAIVVYYGIKNEIKGTLPDKKQTFVIGLIAGAMFFVKYNFDALIFGYLIFVLVSSLARKKYKDLLVRVGIFLLGFALAIAPGILYFYLNGALNDFITAYFYNNIFLYGMVQSKFHIQNNLYYISYSLRQNEHIYLLLLLALFFIGATKKGVKNMYLLMTAMVILATYGMSMHMFYYGFILTALLAPGWAMVAFLYGKLNDRIDKATSSRSLMRFVPVFLIVIVTATKFITHDNIPYLMQPEENIPQVQIGKIISETSNPKVLTYDVMDGGFYTYSGALPANKYYCFLNIKSSLKELGDSQDEAIRNGEFDYIITFSDEFCWDKYEIVYSHTNDRLLRDAFGLIEETYYLYKRVE